MYFDDTGTLLSEQRYLPFGDVRTDMDTADETGEFDSISYGLGGGEGFDASVDNVTFSDRVVWGSPKSGVNTKAQILDSDGNLDIKVPFFNLGFFQEIVRDIIGWYK